MIAGVHEPQMRMSSFLLHPLRSICRISMASLFSGLIELPWRQRVTDFLPSAVPACTKCWTCYHWVSTSTIYKTLTMCVTHLNMLCYAIKSSLEVCFVDIKLCFRKPYRYSTQQGPDVAPCACVYPPAGSRCDWQAVTQALMNKVNKTITYDIFLTETMHEDTSCCKTWEQRREKGRRRG